MLHPVIQSILNRRGLSVPINDGKKITLVLYGGVMAGVAGGASVIALEELGLSGVFDNIFVVSAGLPNASYFLSKQTKLGTSIYYEDLNDRKFINFWRFWNPINTDKVVNAIRYLKPLDVKNVLSSKTKIFVRLFNIGTDKAEYLRLNEYCKTNDDYFSVLKTAITFSTIYNSYKIDGRRYVDGAMRNKGYILDHFKCACKEEFTDMLIIYNKGTYNLNISSDKICEIVLPTEMSNFETKDVILRQESIKAGLYVKQAFGVNEQITL
ncbi:MAG: patatin-like phospholipase family protein [Candidatus Paceibacterota bacterium]|jgi:predicted patatin/cPLA2 family phospholipase